MVNCIQYIFTYLTTIHTKLEKTWRKSPVMFILWSSQLSTRLTRNVLPEWRTVLPPQWARFLTHNPDWCFQNLVHQNHLRVPVRQASSWPSPRLAESISRISGDPFLKEPQCFWWFRNWKTRDEWNSVKDRRVPRCPGRLRLSWATPVLSGNRKWDRSRFGLWSPPGKLRPKGNLGSQVRAELGLQFLQKA